MKGWLRLIATALVVFIVGALVTDRLALLIWRTRIQRYYLHLKESVEKAGAVDPLHYYAPSPQNLITMGQGKDVWQVPLLTVQFSGPSPDRLMVDGNGSLVLVYTPPLLAWSRHLPFLGRPREPVQGTDLYAFNDIYFLAIATLEGKPGGNTLAKPDVSLEHGLLTRRFARSCESWRRRGLVSVIDGSRYCCAEKATSSIKRRSSVSTAPKAWPHQRQKRRPPDMHISSISIARLLLEFQPGVSKPNRASFGGKVIT